jgi:tryptophan halogenase
MSEQVRDILIAGGGLAGWYSAARLCLAMRGRAIRVRVVRASAADQAPDPLDVFCASTLSDLPVVNAELGIDERGFMRACDATFKLATEYHGFADPGRSYLLPFGEIGARIEAVGFHHFLSRLSRGGRDLSMDDFSVPSLAARSGRFAHPTRDARSVLSTYEYGYHLDTAAYTRLLRGIATRLGAVAIDADLAHVEASEEKLDAIVLADGTRLTADFFIDCTGARAALLGQALNAPFESWRHWLPCDGAFVAQLPASDDIAPCTFASARDEGWHWRVPLHNAVRSAFFFDSGAATPPPPPGAATIRFENGLHRQMWRSNCVAIGAAAGFLEPLASTGMRLIDAGITQLIALFPHQGDMRLLSTEYNRVVGELYDCARDFVALHYLLSRRDTGPWPAARDAQPAGELARCLELFRHRGRMMFDEDEMFEEAWWACACYGLGERPEHFSVLAEQSGEAELQAMVDRIARLMRSAVEKLPPHRAYLQEYLA